jgi:hypothetical protein
MFLNDLIFADICGFFSSPDDESLEVIRFMLEGLKKGEKVFHTVDPGQRAARLQRSASAGVDATALLESGPTWGARTIGLKCICVMVCSTSREHLPGGSR